MVEMLTACTDELDDIPAAVVSILTQLDLPHRQKKNSAAIISCHLEFIELGVVAAIIEKLPFPVIGCTSHGVATNDRPGIINLAIAVLTDDEAEFSVASAEINAVDYENEIGALYDQAAAALTGRAKLCFALFPLDMEITPEMRLDALNKKNDNQIPIFGSVGSMLPYYQDNVRVFNRSACSRSLMSILLCGGEIAPQFYYANTITDSQNYRGVIGTVTQSDMHAVYTVDDKPAKQFFASAGVYENSELFALPILVDHLDGTPPSAASILSITDDAVFHNKKMPIGSRITPLGYIDRNMVVATAEKISADILAQTGCSCAFVCSCISRIVILAPDEEKEMSLFREKFGGTLPFFMFYSGGEICPQLSATNQQLYNRFHNYTCSVMTL